MKFQKVTRFQINIWFFVFTLGMLSTVLSLIVPSSGFFLIMAIAGLSLGILSLLYYHFAEYRFLFPIAGLMGASLLSRFEVQVGNFDVRIEHLIGLVAFFFYITARTASGYRPIRLTKSTILLLSWILINLIASQLNAPDPTDSWKHVARMVVLGLTFLTVANGLVDRRQWFIALRLWLSLGALEAVFGITAWVVAQMSSVNIGIQVSRTLPFPVPYGTMLEGNLFGSFAASLVVMYAFLIFRRTRRKDSELVGRKSLWLGSSAVAIALALSFSRGAWVASLFGLVVTYVVSSKNTNNSFGRIALLGAILPVFMCVLLILLPVVDNYLPIASRIASFRQLEHDLTWQARLEDANLALKDWLRHPLIGNGTGSFAQIHGLIRGEPAWVSNLILHTLVDTGVMGLLIQLLLFLLIVFGGLHWSRQALDQRLRVGLATVSLGTIAILIAYLATDGTWFATFWIQLGLVSSGIRIAARNARRKSNAD